MQRRQATRLHRQGIVQVLQPHGFGTFTFDSQQVIHPNQVVTVNASFVPTFHGEAHILSRIPGAGNNVGSMSIGNAEILRAAKILHRMNIAHSHEKGAFGLEMEGGGKEMIDAPMLKQVCVPLFGEGCRS